MSIIMSQKENLKRKYEMNENCMNVIQAICIRIRIYVPEKIDLANPLPLVDLTNVFLKVRNMIKGLIEL